MKMDINLDEIVGLTLEFAKAHHINIIVMGANPSKEEKIQFLRDILPFLPTDSHLADIVMKYLVSIDKGEEEEKKFIIGHGKLETGFTTIYRVKDTVIGTFYVVALKDGNHEVMWGCGFSVRAALKSAEIEWNRLRPNFSENPFTRTLKWVQTLHSP